MSERLELKVVFAAVDKFLRPVKNITAGASEASKALKANNDNLKELNRTLGQVDAFKKAERDAAIAANAFKGTQTRIAAMRAEIERVGVPTKAMVDALATAGKEADRLKQRHESLMGTQQRLFAQLKAGGVDTSRMADEHRRLATAQATATNATQRLSAALEVENQKMKRIHAARAQLAKTKETAGKMATAGAGIAAGGAAVSLPVGIAAKEFATFETAMLGVARQVDGARDANGKLTPTYYEIGDAVKRMSERIPMAANDIAKIVASGARMGIQGKENLLIYAETTAIMATAFELPVEQVGEDMGKIANLFKVPIKDIATLGDTINWLDDNAQSKGSDIIDVVKRIAGVTAEAGMSFKESAALGSTFLSLGASAEVAASASQAMIRELAVANMQSKRFREGAGMLGLDLKALQKSATTDATGTIIKVLEAINKLPQDRRIEAATRIFGKEYGDDASKLAGHLDEYRRQLQLVNAERAKGSMQREGDARNDTLNARLDMAKNAASNLTSELGAHLKPALVEAAEKTVSIMQAARDWAKENPTLAGGLMTVVKWLALGLSVIGALAVAGSAILVPLAAMKFSLTTLGLSVGPLAGKLWAIISPIGKVIAAFGAGYAIGTLLNDVLNKGTSYILGYETSLGGAVFELVERVKSGGSELLAWFRALPSRMQEAGLNMVDGFIQGIKAKWASLKETVSGMAAGAVDWVKEKLGIRSPSRVFAELGGFTMQGFEQGLLGGEDGPLGAMASMAKKLASLGAGIAIGSSAMAQPIDPPLVPTATRQVITEYQESDNIRPPMAAAAALAERISRLATETPIEGQRTADIRLDTRPPISPAAMSAGSPAPAPIQATFHIYGAPGQDPADIRRQVEMALEDIEARRSAKARRRLSDSE